ncbi:carbonic anhydrase [Undibacterium sp. SXout11W]|uniref:carbonic anhydrase n=1 Tax=Undibacterium sp. SXout11W TaxID=3413050 RepID=UPI003BF3C046
MRRYSVLLLSLLLAISASANESSSPSSSPPSKPIKQSSTKEKDKEKEKEEAPPAKEKEGRKSSKEGKEGKESKDAAKESAKEALAADELAAKIAERLAVLRKEKEEVNSRASARSVMHPVYAPRRAEPVKPKAEMVASAAALPDHGAAAIAKAMDAHGAGAWGYQGETGPLSWGKLSPANSKCDIGDRQSPIDIRDGIRVDLDPIVFDYRVSGFNVIDNGHTVQVNVGAGNYITVMGRNYELVQFHFHKPSEERINGKSFEMVVHLVHKDADGKYAVIAVLIERGKPHSAIQQVWNNLPLEKTIPQEALTPLDLNKVLPQKREYYTYMGSLTTPPCTEGVLWMVMKEPIELSPEQIGIFNRLYSMNARPIQKSSGRLIKESN